MFPDRALQLPECKHGLHQSCGPDRMAAGQQAPGGIHGNPALIGQFETIINRRQERHTTLDEVTTLAILAEAQIFIGLDL